MASGSTLIDPVTLLSAQAVTGTIPAALDGPSVIKYDTTVCRCQEDIPDDCEERHDQRVRSRPICGMVALSCFRMALELWADGLRELELLERLVSVGIVKVSSLSRTIHVIDDGARI